MKVKCFICKKDITKGVKVVAHHNYPYQYWSEKTKNWKKKLLFAINGMMCEDCAEMDLNVAHFMTKRDAIYQQVRQEIRQEIFNKQNWFIKLFLK